MSLDENFARLTAELNAATSRQDVRSALFHHDSWIRELSDHGRERLFAAVQDVLDNKQFPND